MLCRVTSTAQSGTPNLEPRSPTAKQSERQLSLKLTDFSTPTSRLVGILILCLSFLRAGVCRGVAVSLEELS